MASAVADPSVDRLARKMVNDCGIQVFRAVTTGSKLGGNCVLPFLELNWTLAALATVSDGQARRQLRHILRHEIVGPEVTDRRVYSMYKAVKAACSRQDQMLSGCALWIPPMPAAMEAMAGSKGQQLVAEIGDAFGMSLAPLEAAAERANMANRWVQRCTAGKVLRLEPDNNTLQSSKPTQAIVTIVSHCRVEWAKAFKERLTWPTEFMAEGNRPQLCQMMHRRDTYGLAESDEYQMVTLDTSTDLQLSFLLPHFGSVDERIAEFTVEKWHEIRAATHPTEMKLYLPKIKVDSSCHPISGDLAALGADNLLADNQGTLSGVADGMSLSSVVQRSVLEYDETGATADESPKFEISCAASCREVRFDRPFLIALHQGDCIMQLVKIASLAGMN